MKLKARILKNLVPFLASFLMVFQSLAPAAIVFAQEESPSPETPPQDQPSASPTSSPSAEPSVSPSPTDSPSPSDQPPQPSIQPSDSPAESDQPQSNNPNQTDQSKSPPPASPTSPDASLGGPSPKPEIKGDEHVSINLVSQSNKPLSPTDLFDQPYGEPSAYLSTDKKDYSPTEAAVITGTGFSVNTTYTLIITSQDPPAVNFQTQITSDYQGTFTYTYQLDGNYRPNYKVEVKDSSGTIVATVTFTDANPAADIDQCRNGAPGSPVTCTGSAWSNGNAGSSNSHYREGDSIPYRIKFTSLTSGSSYTVTIAWDTTKGGKHAIDYLTTYNRTEVAADPCSGIALCGPPSPFAIPDDPNSSVLQAAGNLTLFNGTITGLSAYTLSGTYAGDSTTKITITFTAGNATPVLSWGGHIASQIDWGAGNSAVNISGSPYHTAQDSCSFGCGAQDRSLSASAILPTPTTSTQVKKNGASLGNNGTINLGESVTDTAALSGSGNNPPAVTGTINFFVCGPAGSPPDCTTGGIQVGSFVTISSNQATSSTFTASQLGNYCFRAQYIPDATTQYSPINHTNITSECFNVIQTVGSVKVNKLLDSDGNGTYETTNPGTFNWSLDGSGTNSMGSTVSGVNTGTHSVDENNVTNYHFVGWYVTSDTSKSCTNNPNTSRPISNSVTNGQTTEITICNARDTGTIKVIKDVIPNDNSQWDISISGPTNNSTTLPDGGQTSTYVSATGAYTVAESAHTGTNANDYTSTYSCLNGQNSVTNGSGTSANFTLVTGQNVVCTFSNTIKNGNVVVTKYHDHNANGTKDNGDEVLNGWEIHLNQSSQFTGAQVNGQVTFSDLLPGSYTLSEQIQSSWFQSNISCTGDQGIDNDNSHSVSVAPGATVQCSIGNYQNAAVTIIKDVRDQNGNDVSDTAPFTAKRDGGDAKSFGEGSNAAYTVAPGTYTFTEDAKDGYTLHSITPDNDSDSSNGTFVLVASGENDTITFVNYQNPASISGHKYGPDGTTGLLGWTINLLSCASNFTNCIFGQSTTTDQNGLYAFNNLTVGFYRVEEVMQAGWTNVTALFHNVTSAPGSETTNQDFQNKGNLSITACKYEDSNGTAEGGNFTAVNGWAFRIGEITKQASEVNNCVTFTDLKPGTYSVTEIQIGHDGWSVADGSGGTKVVNLTDENQTVNFYNYRKATIIVEKITNPNSDEIFDFNLIQDVEIVDTKHVSGGNSDEFANLEPGGYSLTELSKAGWDLTGANCTGIEVFENGGSITVTSGQTVTCTFHNTQRGSVGGFKWNDEDGNGQRCILNLEILDFLPLCESTLSGWHIQLFEDNDGTIGNQIADVVTDQDGNYLFDNLIPGNYWVCEVNQHGWEQTYPNNDSRNPRCWQIILEGGGQVTNQNFGNRFVPPVLNISKTNNKLGLDLGPGSDVTYTLTITVSQNAANNVFVKDLLPGGFTYHSGSWQATLNGAPFAVPEPVYASPGTWNLGNLANGDVVVLTLIADISGSEQAGLYKDVAWAQGNAADSSTVLASAVNPGFVDTNFVGTQVNIVTDPGNSASVNVENRVQGQVLGASTSVLPETGASTIWVILAASGLITGAALVINGFRLRRKHA